MELIERVRGRIMKAGIVFSPSPPTSLSSGHLVWYGTHCANSWPDRAASDLGRQAQDVSQCRHCITRSDKLSLFPPGLTPRVPLSWSPTSNNLVYKNDVHWSCGTRLPSDFQLLMLCFKCCLTWVLTMSMPYFASLLDTS